MTAKFVVSRVTVWKLLQNFFEVCNHGWCGKPNAAYLEKKIEMATSHIDSCRERALKVCDYLSKGGMIFIFTPRHWVILLITKRCGVVQPTEWHFFLSVLFCCCRFLSFVFIENSQNYISTCNLILSDRYTCHGSNVLCLQWKIVVSGII